jgi:hypothetical protein
MEPDLEDIQIPGKYIVFKPHSIQRMKCTKVGDPIDCDNTDCIQCVYTDCRIRKNLIERNKWLEEHKS